MIETVLSLNKKIIIFAKNKYSQYLFCNEYAAEAAGLDSPKQIIGKTDDDLFWQPYAEYYRRCDRHVLRGNPFINEIIPFTQPSKIVSSILSCETILTSEKGGKMGVAGHAIDVTGYSVTKNCGYVDPQKHTFCLGPYFCNEYLTKREFEVFKYLLLGKSVDEIAFQFSRSIKTIQSQIKSIANKLQCSHKSEIIPTAVKYGLTYVLSEISFGKNNLK
ncbi:MAG: hypothetical protein COY58_05295 [Gammaproteobacteria bacterium CG_4_10_14_0_8_um_filter_38_16]|nr:MAG: hypothetical protein COY58_05295 [Gammaproteobacteria bacterium CG_4_10_14_0_8_um_filter_38_16]PJA02853.1 MAG: hypothetical protein COX72_08680 [Gammaproteobacteria bacterium CG_4_10_14_0_2_um_filter_38_22]PJB10687.1 MAG: hypothetical protein CO120_03580 [Gammaproteobacteria bacterium CG_4_9_14_3_um_filter_38_9]